MAKFEHINRINIGDIELAQVHVSGGTYATLSLTDKTGQVVQFELRNNEALKKFIEMIVTTALKADWSKDNKYPNAWIDSNSDLHDLAAIQQFAPFDVQPEQDAEPPF